jgi:hypothetical protein
MKKLLALMVILGVAVLCVAAFYVLSGNPPEKTGKRAVRLIIFVDQSASIPEAQQTQWEKTAGQLFDRLGTGDGIVIFGLHDQSLNAKPIYQADVPILDDEAGLEDRARWKRRLNQIREQAKAAFQQALNPQQRALSTDIFSAINRVQPDRSRKTVLIFMSDMLHSTPELDLEKVRLSEEKISDLLNPVIAKHRWPKGMLAEAEVHCVLNSVNMRESSPLNDRIILQQFWATLFEYLGAGVETFETHLTLKQ